MSQPAIVDDGMVSGVSNIYRDAEEKLIALMAAKTNAGLEHPEWAERRLSVVQEYRLQAERITSTAGDHAADAAEQALRVQYNRGNVDAVAELSERNRITGGATGGYVDTHGVAQLAAETRRVVTAPASGMAITATTAMQAVTLEALGPTMVGAATRREMAQSALNKFASTGITGFTDTAGRRWRADTYTDMAMRTQMANARIAGHTARLQQHGQDLVVVSAHRQGCELCAPFEGAVLSLGVTPAGQRVQANEITGDPVTFDVKCTVDQARDAGLFHPNCGHVYSAYFPGITPELFGESDPTDYKNSQEMRYLERGARKWKRLEAAALDPEAKRLASGKVKLWNARIKDFAQTPGVTRKPYREGLSFSGLGRRGVRASPTDALGGRVRLGSTGPTPTPIAKPKPLHMRHTDAELEAMFNKALNAGEFEKMDMLGVEWQKRMDLDKVRIDRNALATQKRHAKKAADEAVKSARLDELVAEGWDYREAHAQAYNVPIERLLRQEAIYTMRADGLRGAGFDELSRKSYANVVHREYSQAESAVRTHMLSPEGEAKKIDPRRLWQMNDATAEKYASEDLRRHWNEVGRTSLAEHRADMLDPVAAQRMRDARGDYFE